MSKCGGGGCTWRKGERENWGGGGVRRREGLGGMVRETFPFLVCSSCPSCPQPRNSQVHPKSKYRLPAYLPSREAEQADCGCLGCELHQAERGETAAYIYIHMQPLYCSYRLHKGTARAVSLSGDGNPTDL